MRLKKYLQNNKTYLIAEMSANHANDLTVALDIVEAAKNAGADCLKTQVYTASTLTINSDKSLFQITDGLWKGQTLYDLYNSAFMPWDWHKTIYKKCQEVGIDFLATAYDTTAVDFLVAMGVDAIKIASFEAVDIPLIQYAAKKGKTMIISCGMCSCEEIQEAVHACFSVGNRDVVLMKCSSQYPANLSSLNLNTIPDMIVRYGVPVGFSDHSLGAVSSVVAVALGARVIEKHLCLDVHIKTADSSFSMNPEGFYDMVQQIRSAELSRGKIFYGISDEEKESLIFRRSLFAIKEIGKGETFSKENIQSIRPGYGISPKYYDFLIGRKANRDIESGEPLRMDDLEDTE